MTWTVDERIATTTCEVSDFPLSRLFLKNDANYLWFVLVPRVEGIQEIYELPACDRAMLIEEIAAFSQILKASCAPLKINVGALGNIVTQLHIHVVARFKDDIAWPHGVWQENTKAKPYEKIERIRLIKRWRKLTESVCVL